jgi:8-oxo-dGTP pyrophosphatase MutT (NUDIX family)
MNKNTNICNNCGKQGHQFYQCKLPITSYGIILFKSSSVGLKFLMIRRKDSFGYIDFIRGKYAPHNIEHLINIFDEMSNEEKKRILKKPFEELWSEMWGDTNNVNSQYKSEEIVSKKKFELLKDGIIIDNKVITLNDIILKSTTSWDETEWEFPKGRRNHKEKDLDCALREFQEETGISSDSITVIENIMPFEEIFIGSNHKSYKHKYFLAYMNDNMSYINSNYVKDFDKDNFNFQTTEVSKIEWKTFDECLESIRPYNLEKKQLINNINKILQQYRLYL